MRGGLRPHTQGLMAISLSGQLRIAHEEGLLRRYSVTWGRNIFGDFGFPCRPVENQSARVSHVFAGRNFAGDFDVINNAVLRILIDNALRASRKFVRIFFRPPVSQTFLGIKLATFNIEGVSQLVANGTAGIARV